MDVGLRRQDSVGSASAALKTTVKNENHTMEKLYAGFFENSTAKVYDFDEAELTATVSPMMMTGGLPRSSRTRGKMATPTSLISRMGAATATISSGGGNKMRPSTAVRGVGYTSESRGGLATAGGIRGGAMGSQAKRTGVLYDSRKEQSPEEKCKALEKRIQDLLEQSILMTSTNSNTGGHNIGNLGRIIDGEGRAPTNTSEESKADLRGALNKAKEAASLDRKLLQLRDAGDFVHNFDLTFSVLFNLAHLYALNEMHTEALNTYNLITKNKKFSNANRLKINMGNICVRLGMFPKAIKMYRMALDQVPVNQKELRLRVTHNIGVLFVRMGQYSDAAASFEFIMAERGDIKAAMHLVLCYYALGDVDKMKRAFQIMLEVDTGDGGEVDDERLAISAVSKL